MVHVVYEDLDVLVIEKPPGMHSLRRKPDETGTAVDFALQHDPGQAKIPGSPLEYGLIHRLDQETSGLLVFARTAEERDRLRGIWNLGQVKKTYRALVSPAKNPRGTGEFPPLPHTIDFPMVHLEKPRGKMKALLESPNSRNLRFTRGKPQEAHTQIVRQHPMMADPDGRFPEGTLDLEIEIQKGVMHQIRCHLAAIDFPIVGDTKYGGSPSDRLYLHAWKLELPLKSGRALSLKGCRTPY